MAEGTPFGPTAGAEFGGFVAGSVVYRITMDGRAVPATIEETKRIVAQASPQIQQLLTYQARINVDGVKADLQRVEASVEQSAQRIRRSFDQSAQRFRETSSGRFAAAPDAITASLARQEAANREAFARAQATVIGTPTSGPLGLRADLARSLPPLDTAPFKRSTEDAISSLRGVGRAGLDASAAVQRGFGAAGQRIAQAGEQVGTSWANSFKGMAAGVVAFESAKELLHFIADESQKANQALFALNKTFGAGGGEARKFAETVSGEIGRSIADIEAADAELQRTGRVVGLTRQQVLQLGLVAADLAAVSGRSQEQTGHAVAAAFLGQPRGLDILGIPATQAILKQSGELEEAQRRNAGATELATKSQALFNLIMKEAAPLQGAARERAHDAAGAQDRLAAATSNLAASIGSGNTPITKATQSLASLAEALATANRETGALNTGITAALPGLAALGVVTGLGGAGGPRAAGGFAAGRFPGQIPAPPRAFGGDTADQDEAIRRRVVAAASTPLFTPPPLTGVEEFSAALARQEAAALADKKSIADLSDEQERHARVSRVATLAILAGAAADQGEAERHRAITTAVRVRAAAYEEAARAAGALGAAVAGVRAVEAGGALGGQVPRLFERQTAAEQQAAGRGGDLVADAFRKREQARQDAIQQQKQVAAEVAREAERDLRSGEDAALAASRKRADDEVAGIDRAADARQRAHQEDVRQIEEAHRLDAERFSDQQALLGIRHQQADAADAEKKAAEGLRDAEADLAKARGGPSGLRAGGPTAADFQSAGQRAEAVRRGEKAVRDAQEALAKQQTQQAQSALSAGLLGGGAELTAEQIRAAVERLQRAASSQSGLDLSTRQRAGQIATEAGLSREQQAALPPSERAAIAEAIANALGRGNTEEERDAARRKDEAERQFEQDERLLKDWRDGTKANADAQQEAARQQLEAARESRATAAAWRALGLAPPNGVPALPAQPAASDGGASAPSPAAPAATATVTAGGSVFHFEGATFSAGVSAQDIADSVVAGFNESKGAR